MVGVMPLIPLAPMSAAHLQSLSRDELVDRMDLVLHTAATERGDLPYGPQDRIRDLVDSAWAARHPDRTLLAIRAAFQFLVQRQLITSSHVALNVLYYDKPVEGRVLEHSPALRLYHASFNQQSIIQSRIAFECFMELVYALGEGTGIPGKRKFRHFRKWLFEPENPFCYFARDVVAAHRYDREHRTPEVHARSKLVRGLLSLETADSEVDNLRLGLNNLLFHLWPPLIEIVNDRKPTVFYSSQAHTDDWRRFGEAYVAHDPEPLRAMLGEMAATIQD